MCIKCSPRWALQSGQANQGRHRSYVVVFYGRRKHNFTLLFIVISFSICLCDFQPFKTIIGITIPYQFWKLTETMLDLSKQDLFNPVYKFQKTITFSTNIYWSQSYIKHTHMQYISSAARVCLIFWLKFSW